MNVDNATAGDELSELGVTGNEARPTRAGRVVWDSEAENDEMMVKERNVNRIGTATWGADEQGPSGPVGAE